MPYYLALTRRIPKDPDSNIVSVLLFQLRYSVVFLSASRKILGYYAKLSPKPSSSILFLLLTNNVLSSEAI
jgi:hypothetical protein